MPLVLADRVRETTTTTGTGTISLAGPVSGFQGFSTAIGNANTTYYTIVDAATGAWEVGLGTYTSSGSTLARTTVLSSSNSDALVPFASGTKDVFVTQPAERAVYVLGAGTGLAAGAAAFTANGVPYASATNTLTTGSALTFDGTNLTQTAGTPVFTVFESASGNNNRLILTQNSGLTTYNLTYSTASTNGHVFQIGGGEQMRLTSTGLGIGTSSTAAKLNVVTAGTALANFTGAQYSQLRHSDGTRTLYTQVYDNLAILGTESNTPLSFVTNGTIRATFDTSGNLGIGSTSPGARLDVQAPEGRILLTSTTGTNASYFTAVNTGGSFFIGRDNSAGGLSGTAYAAALISTGAYPMVFGTNAAERMRLDSSGNLGLGVTPSAWTFATAAQVGYGAALSSRAAGSTASDMTHSAYWNGTNWVYQNSSVGAARYQMTGSNSGSTHAWFVSAGGTSGNAITFTQAMTLDASGNLGVGITNPTAKLEVYGGASGTVTNIQVGNAATGFVFGIDSGNSCQIRTAQSVPILFYTAGTERARITSGGDLLVGTADAAQTSGAGFKVGGVGGIGVAQVAIVDTDSTNTTVTYRLYSTGASAYRFYVGLGGTIYATNATITSLSDQRLKENIQDIDVGLDAIMALNPRKFDWRAGKGKDKKGDRGWIAQEFEQVFPDMVDTWQDPAPEGEEPYKAVNADLIPVLVKAIQELKAEFDAYKATHP